MKFDLHDYWRHKNSLDVFFKINSVAFDDDGRNAILHGAWFIQGQTAHWIADYARLKITPDQYANWYKYNPEHRRLT